MTDPRPGPRRSDVWLAVEPRSARRRPAPRPRWARLLWTVPLVLLLGAVGFVVGTLGWCGDDALGCRSGVHAALESAITALASAVVTAVLIGLVSAAAVQVGAVSRRRIGVAAGAAYLVLAIGYLVVTLGIHGGIGG
ncbi:hypothetical protein [Schumannella soli]|uniref:Uncharacterized protein n=1 Tax=Schumannella soli TaxID=2590779 RepID=A0A506XND1_9MICO|nr:hypothetical protein [Schumannella soli]TPW74164.1 hypothetical protein FJ657_16150 [Schumannella soli]